MKLAPPLAKQIPLAPTQIETKILLVLYRGVVWRIRGLVWLWRDLRLLQAFFYSASQYLANPCCASPAGTLNHQPDVYREEPLLPSRDISCLGRLRSWLASVVPSFLVFFRFRVAWSLLARHLRLALLLCFSFLLRLSWSSKNNYDVAA